MLHLITVKHLCVAYCCHRLLIHLGRLYKQMQFTSPVACCHFQKISGLWLLTVCRFLLRHLAGYLAPLLAVTLAGYIKILVLADPWCLDLFKRNLMSFFYQVFAALVTRMNRSPDAVVRASCSFALGLLLKAFNPLAHTVLQIDQTDSGRSNITE